MSGDGYTGSVGGHTGTGNGGGHTGSGGGYIARGGGFIGRGWGFPLRTGATGGIALVERDKEIEEAIGLILGTAPGERPMRPEFGCGIHDYVFAPGDGATAGRIAQEVRTSLERWEPRIEVTDVVIAFDAIEEGTLYIDVRYTVRATNDLRNLVFPFYTIPSEEGSSEASEAEAR